MGILDLFKKKKPEIQILLDDFFEDLAIYDVVAAVDIPILKIDGIEKRAEADIFFRKHYQWMPVRINSFTDKLDIVFWLFDTFCVLELNSTDDLAKQFVVLKHSKENLNGLPHMVAETAYSIKTLKLKEEILKNKELFELIVFKQIIDLFERKKYHAIEILNNKYY